MERIALPVADVLEELRKRRCVLHHANAAETSLTYFHTDAIHSRERLMELSLPQAGQWSDPLDAKWGILNDIFLNLADLHKTFSKPNNYGPVLFRTDLAKLSAHLIQKGATISVTKKPPHTWSRGDSALERWLTFDEFVKSFPYDVKDPVRASWASSLIDIVVGGLTEGIPLSCVDQVKVDEVPNDSGFYSRFSAKAQELNPGASGLCKPRAGADCTTSCRCSDPQSFSRIKLQGKVSLGKWNELFAEDFRKAHAG